MDWEFIDWICKLDYNEVKGVICYGYIWVFIIVEYVVLCGVKLELICFIFLKKIIYKIGWLFDLDGLIVFVWYFDGVEDEEVVEGYGGFIVLGYNFF